MAFVNSSDTFTSIQSKANVTYFNKGIAFFEVFKFTSAIWMLLLIHNIILAVNASRPKSNSSLSLKSTSKLSF